MDDKIERNRLVTPDLIRLMAITFVVIVHSNGFFFSDSANPYGLVFSHIVGCLGVPFFVILTGYFMVDREFDQSYLVAFVKRNLIPLIIAFEFWNVIWYLLDKISLIHYTGGGFPLTLSRVVKAGLFIGDTGTAMWYMPMIIGLYLGIPIISWFCSRCVREWNVYGIVIILLVAYFGTIVPTASYGMSFLQHPVGIHSVLNMNIFGATVWGDSVWILYCVSGFLIKTGRFDRIRTWCLILIGLAAGCCLFFTERAVVLGKADTTLCQYASVFIVILAICLFVLMLRMKSGIERWPALIQRFVSFIGTYSFAVYMIHLFVIGTVVNLFQHGGALPIGDSLAAPVQFLGYLVFVAFVVTVSAAIAWAIGHIRMIRKWLFLVK